MACNRPILAAKLTSGRSTPPARHLSNERWRPQRCRHQLLLFYWFGAGTNHWTATFLQSTLGPLILATSQPSDLTEPVMVAVLPSPPTSFAVISKVLAVGFIVP